MSMRSLFVSDFDRTLYRDSQISEGDLAAIGEWRNKGNLFAIATGRDETSIRKKLLEWNLEPDYYICNNGARMISADGGIIAQIPMDSAQSRSIADFLRNQDISFAVTIEETRYKILSPSGKDGYPELLEQMSANYFYMKSPAILQIHKRFETPEPAIKLACELNRRFLGISAFANERNVDIVARSVDKGDGVQRLLAWLEQKETISPDFATDHVVVIGDSLNDIPMIRKYHGFTVSTANPEVKKIASAVCRDIAECLGMVNKI